MCTTVTLPDGTWLESIRELADAGIRVDSDVMDADQGLDNCLCGVDVQEVLRRNRLRWRDDFGGGFLDLEEMPG